MQDTYNTEMAEKDYSRFMGGSKDQGSKRIDAIVGSPGRFSSFGLLDHVFSILKLHVRCVSVEGLCIVGQSEG